MELWLVDRNTDLIEAWQQEFADFPEVRVVLGDIMNYADNTLVSPANGHGLMDGAIDGVYTLYFRRFGIEIGKKVQEAILAKKGRDLEGRINLLEVGEAVFVPTGDERIPYLIAAPTMLIPRPVPAANACFAMNAILRCAEKYKDVVTRVFCPGLATGTGRVSPEDAAREMAHCYRKRLKKNRRN